MNIFHWCRGHWLLDDLDQDHLSAIKRSSHEPFRETIRLLGNSKGIDGEYGVISYPKFAPFMYRSMNSPLDSQPYHPINPIPKKPSHGPIPSRNIAAPNRGTTVASKPSNTLRSPQLSGSQVSCGSEKKLFVWHTTEGSPRAV